MKRRHLFLVVGALGLMLLFITKLWAADGTSFQTVEFATIRWAGRENTSLIRPNGKVEKLKPLFDQHKRPDGLDERSFYLSIAMNAIAREGYDLAGMTDHEIVLRRPIAK